MTWELWKTLLLGLSKERKGNFSSASLPRRLSPPEQTYDIKDVLVYLLRSIMQLSRFYERFRRRQQHMAEVPGPSTFDIRESAHPGIFQKLALNISDENFQYLRIKGALSPPPLQLRNRILQAYIRWIHPLLPVLDLPSFLHGLVMGDELQFSSPFLYQSVMFAGSAFLEFCDIRTAGYASPREIRKVFFERAKLLYEFDSEPNQLIQVQALVLMTHWLDDVDEPKNPSHWLNLAFSAAQRAGFHLPDSTDGSSSVTSSVKRRVWWCLYLRDRILALGLRRPLQVRDGDFCVPKLSLEDFEIRSYKRLVLTALGPSATLFTPHNQQRLAAMFLEEIKLAYCIGAVVEETYHGSWGTRSTGELHYSLVPKEAVTMETVRKCEKLLRSWFDGKPGVARYHPPFLMVSPDRDSLETVLLVHQAFLHLLYLTALSALYRPVMISAATLHSTFADTLHGLAFEIIKTLNELQDVQLLSLLPGTSVTMLLFAVATHLQNLSSSDETVRLQSFSCLNLAQKAATQLQQTYPAAKLVLSLTQHAVTTSSETPRFTV